MLLMLFSTQSAWDFCFFTLTKWETDQFHCYLLENRFALWCDIIHYSPFPSHMCFIKTAHRARFCHIHLVLSSEDFKHQEEGMLDMDRQTSLGKQNHVDNVSSGKKKKFNTESTPTPPRGPSHMECSVQFSMTTWLNPFKRTHGHKLHAQMQLHASSYAFHS